MRTARIVTLNIWNRGGPWEERLVAIRAGVADLAPDVIGLQEVLRPSSEPPGNRGGEGLDQAHQIAEGFGYHIAFGAAMKTGGVDFGNAVLSKFPILRTQTFELPQLDAAESRCLVFAELDAPFGKFPFFCTHLSWRFDEGHVREAQVKAIGGHINQLAPAVGFPPVIVGDFNAAPDSDEIRFMTGLCSLGGRSVYFADAFGLVGHGDGTTFSRRNPFATEFREPDRRIDYIFVRGPDQRGRGEPLDSSVCFDRPVNGVYPTDHFGVTATIKVAA
jgi:endonuclease/exonuclease/phosphatase family metal-dependent hydrolase